eukprot:7294480-Pyramimonas_sp.AAC.1
MACTSLPLCLSLTRKDGWPNLLTTSLGRASTIAPYCSTSYSSLLRAVSASARLPFDNHLHAQALTGKTAGSCTALARSKVPKVRKSGAPSSSG